MIVISNHAALRYVQRVMGLVDVVSLNKKQLNKVKARILSTIKEYLPMPFGTLWLEGAGYVFKEDVLVTVKLRDSEGVKRFCGGITRSGKKIKKEYRRG